MSLIDPCQHCPHNSGIVTARCNAASDNANAQMIRADKAEAERDELKNAVHDAFNRAQCERKSTVRQLAADISWLHSQAANHYKQRLQVERERDALLDALAGGPNDCPYLTFWADCESPVLPDWCICTDTEDGGFDCIENPGECWKMWAALKAEEAQS